MMVERTRNREGGGGARAAAAGPRVPSGSLGPPCFPPPLPPSSELGGGVAELASRYFPFGGSGWCSLDGVVAFRDSCTRLPARSFDRVLLPFSQVPDCSILAAFLLVLDCFGCSLG
ncbi:hypothetical protein NL676_008296 [Syzygium grande]|nr:hypothetical protein NL676_008296 [Syzygium grande]